MKARLIPNFFEKKDFIEAEAEYKAQSVADHFRELFPDHAQEDFYPILNGSKASWDDTPPIDGDLIFIQDITGGGGGIFGGFFGAILGAALIAVAWWNPLGWGAMGVMVCGGLGFGMMMSSVAGMFMPKMSVPSTDNDFSDSQTYGWDGVQNTYGDGSVIPVVYGTHRVGGVVVEGFVEGQTGWGKQTNKLCNILCAVSEGPIGGIKHETFQINKKELRYYNEGSNLPLSVVPVPEAGILLTENPHSITMTAAGQKVALKFKVDKLYNQEKANIGVETIKLWIDFRKVGTGSFTRREFVINAASKDEFIECCDIELPENAVYEFAISRSTSVSLTGNIICGYVYLVDMRHYATSSSILDYSYRIGSMNQNSIAAFSKVARLISVTGARIKHGSPYFYKTNDPCDAARLSITFPALYSMTNKGDIAENSVELLVEFAEFGTQNWQSAGVHTPKNNTKSSCDYDIHVDFPGFKKWLVRITRKTPEFTSSKTSGDSFLTRVVEFENAEVTYPCTALIGCKILATDKISGSTPTVTAVVEGKLIRDVRTGKLSASSNPANILYDLLTNRRYGLGKYLREDQIHIESLREFADFCDEMVTYTEYDPATGTTQEKREKRFEFNIVFDKKFKAMEAITKICESCRAYSLWEGDKFKVAINRMAMPVQMFTMSNIVEDSFQETYVGLATLPNQVEAEILDEDDDYEKTTVCGFDSKRSQEDVISKKIQLFGFTKKSRARRELAFQMRRLRALRKVVEFSAGMDAIICEVGDVILFQHDTPQYGESIEVDGLLSDRVIKLRFPIKTDFGRQYSVKWRMDDGSFWTMRFLGPKTGEVTEITSMDLLPPGLKPGCIGAFGSAGKEAKPFRVLSLTRTESNTIDIKAEEYNESIFNDDESIVVVDVNYSGLGLQGQYTLDGEATDPMPVPIPGSGMPPVVATNDAPPYVTDIKLSERIDIVDDRIESTILIHFSPVDMPVGSLSRIDRYEILRSYDCKSWEGIGFCRGNYFEARNAPIGTLQYYLVKPITVHNTTNNIESTAFKSRFYITPTGEAPIPDDVTSFVAVQNGSSIVFAWKPVTNTKVAQYEIRANDWTVGQLVGRTSNETMTAPAMDSGQATFWIKAINLNGVYSANPAKVVITVAKKAGNVIFEIDDVTNGWPGSKERCFVDPATSSLKVDPGADRAEYVMEHIDLMHQTRSRNYIATTCTAIMGSDKTWETSDFEWNSEQADLVWYSFMDNSGVSVEHYISTFSTLPDEFADIIRLANHTESILGVVPTVQRGITHAPATILKGVESTGAMKLRYSLNVPNTYTLLWRHKLPSKTILSGAAATIEGTLGEAKVLVFADGRVWLWDGTGQIALKLKFAPEQSLMFGITNAGGKLVFFAGNTSTGQYESGDGVLNLGKPTGLRFGL